MSANLSPNLDMNFIGSSASDDFSIALIGPDAEKREAVAGALARWPGADVRQFPSYPPAINDVTELLKHSFDVIVVDVESDPDYAIAIMESIHSQGTTTVMAYSWSVKQDLLERLRRAGVREYLDAPFEISAPGALERAASARYAKTSPSRSWEAKLLVFFGAKGGAGTTTLACSYAMALAQESRQRTLLIDLGLPLGDDALNLGLTSDYSTEDAFKDPDQMDPSLLEALVVKHASGLEVLAAPSKVPEISPSSAAIDKVMKVARKVYTNVIVDVGSRVDLMSTTLFTEAYRIYLVSQAGISDLRNAERLMSRYFDGDQQRLEIVINRFEPGAARVSCEQMTSALGRPVRWSVPDERDALHVLQSARQPVSELDSPFSRAVLEMAGSITLHPVRAGKSVSSETASGTGSWQSTSDAAKTPQIGNGNQEQASAGNDADTAGGLPNVFWKTPETITFGTALSDVQLDATASVPGTFVYTPGSGYVLPVGTHTLWVTFTPENGTMVQSAVSITVSKATPTITWPVPRPISCDTPLSELQLNAIASVPGRFEYAPEIGKVLSAGEHALAVVFTPTDDKSYTATKATVSITVEKLKPQIEWPVPEKMPCGAKLGAKQLNAKASVAGTFVYSPESGEVLEPGQHVLTVHFTPAEGSRYTMAQSVVTVTVMKAPPRITWLAPEPIVYGTQLSTGQLNATASEDGNFIYTPGVGTVLSVGEHTPFVTFIPRNNSDYPSIQTAVPLTVVMAKPSIAWNPPQSISAGTPLSKTELNATASVPGTFRYKPVLGEILAVGKHTLTVTFTPTDSMNFEPVKASTQIAVTELGKVQIAWPAPSAIPYGTPLTEAQLNATAPIPGTFSYGPCEGNVLPPGKHTLVAVFTPDDPQTYAVANATVTLKVEPVADIASLLSVPTRGPIDREVEEPELLEIIETEIPIKKSNLSSQRAAAVIEREPVVEREPIKEEAVVIQPTIVQEPPPPTEIETEPTPAARAKETRTYKGVIYEKGDDGQWHRLQK
jgi:Flp pilus assembly protein, ATPase CpaE